MTIVIIRQPWYLPYLGFFKKIQSCDLFIYPDDAQYQKGLWNNRNKIRTFEGSAWLTVPLYHKFGQKLNEVRIANNENWNKKHRMTKN